MLPNFVIVLCDGLGYATSPEQPQPGDHGFGHWFSTQNNAGPSHENPVNFVRNGKPAGPLQGYSSTLIVDEAIAWLKGLPAGRPFCLFACFHASHEPVAFVEVLPTLCEPGGAFEPRRLKELSEQLVVLDREIRAEGYDWRG